MSFIIGVGVVVVGVVAATVAAGSGTAATVVDVVIGGGDALSYP